MTAIWSRHGLMTPGTPTREDMIDEAVRRVVRHWVGPHIEDIEGHWNNPFSNTIICGQVRAEFCHLLATA
ncbi:MAG TPA: hypothetical protein ENH89_18025 [Aurantimonas coralicida]|uniref:Uncharacterized protein n=1 Tax=Aurantimonas coralicida TaxID=182270 RepID=A0A9C9NIK0_9HYPH|nr:hypothetical protein [Aurantimonas coralicida]